MTVYVWGVGLQILILTFLFVYWIKEPLEVNKPMSRTGPRTTFTFADYHSGVLKVVPAMSRYFTTLFQRPEVTKTCLRGPRCCISLFNKLISDSKLVSRHSPRFPGSYLSFRTYSRCVSHQGVTDPFHYPPPHLKRPHLRST